MRRTIYISTVLAALAVLVMAGCSDRGTNVPTRTDTFGYTWVPLSNPPFAPELTLQRGNPNGQLKLAIWAPPQVIPGNAPASLLVLLAPGESSQWFYLERGLHKICNEMIANGEIDPMVVVCVGNDEMFGGYFYGNSLPAGFYDEVIGDALVDHLQFLYPSLINNPARRGIGGIGQGAYGAFRAAIKNPGVFTSITAVDGPLDFDGADGESGFMTMFNDVLFENGLSVATGYSRVDPARRIDSSSANPITRMFIGGSVAFSPKDTGLVSTGLRHNSTLNIIQRQQVSDTLTQIFHLLTGRISGGPIPSTEAIRFDFNLPFDSTSKTHAPTWRRWMANNLDTMLVKQGGSALDNVDIWLATTPEARYTFHDQTVSFRDFLMDDMDLSVDTLTYMGYPGNPAHDYEYVYYLLKDMIKYHADHFRGN